MQLIVPMEIEWIQLSPISGRMISSLHAGNSTRLSTKCTAPSQQGLPIKIWQWLSFVARPRVCSALVRSTMLEVGNTMNAGNCYGTTGGSCLLLIPLLGAAKMMMREERTLLLSQEVQREPTEGFKVESGNDSPKNTTTENTTTNSTIAATVPVPPRLLLVAVNMVALVIMLSRNSRRQLKPSSGKDKLL